MNFLKKKWLQSRWIDSPPLDPGELLRQSTQVKQGLAMGMRLAVLEKQAAAVMTEGRLISVFLPGAYQLEQDKMPLLKPDAKRAWLYPAQLYFLNLALFANQPWRPQSPLLTRDPERGLLQLDMAGSYDAQVENATLFMQFMVVRRGFYGWPALHYHICGRLNDLAVAQTARQYMPLERLPKLKEKIAQTLCEEINRDLRGSGLIVHQVRLDKLGLHPVMSNMLAGRQDYLDFNHAHLRSILS